jgi:2-amino-4-hydroxy-6-hydroxymethyldihydropteridine diphosphokinase
LTKHTAYLLLGSNEGDRLQWLYDALHLLDKHGLFLALSPVYETAAWGLEKQPDFLNIALSIETALTPDGLLKAIREIEQQCGRQRELKWGQRTLDIDILFYDNIVLNEPELVIPHPHLHERRFALTPLNDIAPQLVHPTMHKTVAQLLKECSDTLATTPYEEEHEDEQ